MRAVILAGGKGSRLQPYTTLIPKPLVPVGDKYSIVEIVIKQLVKTGFSHITLAVNHLSKLIMAYFGDGYDLGVKIDYSLETSELGTVGPLTLLDDLPENFLVINGDVISDLNYGNFLKNHISKGNRVTVSSFKREVQVDFGVLQYDSKDHLAAFQEKPKLNYDVSMGAYCFNKCVIDKLQKNMPYGFDNLMIDSLANKEEVCIAAFDGFWLDVGRPSDYDYINKNAPDIFKMLNIE